MGLVRKALDFLKADPPPAADITTPAKPVVSTGLTVCAACTHYRPANWERISARDRWGYARCAATIEKEAYQVQNVISGEITDYPDNFAFCKYTNDGNCPKFSPATKEPE